MLCAVCTPAGLHASADGAADVLTEVSRHQPFRMLEQQAALLPTIWATSTPVAAVTLASAWTPICHPPHPKSMNGNRKAPHPSPVRVVGGGFVEEVKFYCWECN